MQSTISGLAILDHGGIVQGLTAHVPIAQPCRTTYEDRFPSILCIPNHGAVLPEDFYRPISSSPGHADTYGSTVVKDDASFSLIANADFLIWDLAQAYGILGATPTVEIMFNVDNLPHEGPVYEPDLELILFSPLKPPPSLYVIDLKQDPPTLEKKVTDPALFGPGALYHRGLIYFCGSATRSGDYVAGLYALNATSGKTWPVLNNYFGYNFGTCDDLAAAPNGDIWFTDNCKSPPSPTDHLIIL
jgi:hypothetical protein